MLPRKEYTGECAGEEKDKGGLSVGPALMPMEPYTDGEAKSERSGILGEESSYSKL